MSTLETGGCSCGAVRYEVSVKPLIVHCCHCTDCQRLTGSAFAVNALVEADHVRVISGEVAIDRLPTPSGRPQDLYHCAQCSGSLWSDYGQRGYLYFLHTGTLDRPDAFRPDVHIFARSKRDWVVTGADVPVFDAFYDLKSVWSAEALARRKAASDAAKN